MDHEKQTNHFSNSMDFYVEEQVTMVKGIIGWNHS